MTAASTMPMSDGDDGEQARVARLGVHQSEVADGSAAEVVSLLGQVDERRDRDEHGRDGGGDEEAAVDGRHAAAVAGARA